MSTAESQPQGPEVVVGPDGSVPSIPAEVLARFGILPGEHLRLVPETAETHPRRKSIIGALEGKVDVDAFDAAMAWNKAQRIAAVTSNEDDIEQ